MYIKSIARLIVCGGRYWLEKQLHDDFVGNGRVRVTKSSFTESSEERWVDGWERAI